ncbi:MAG: sulfurtransferase TusA family protein [Elusimicrobia bacterium]|nr:sulfurtransferase TusA family protein [Elusimicrobiota bacterium]
MGCVNPVGEKSRRRGCRPFPTRATALGVRLSSIRRGGDTPPAGNSPGRSVIVEARGALCPVPTVLASLALEKRRPGEMVDLLADDPTTRRDLPGWCAEFGHRVLDVVELSRGFRIRIQKHL